MGIFKNLSEIFGESEPKFNLPFERAELVARHTTDISNKLLLERSLRIIKSTVSDREKLIEAKRVGLENDPRTWLNLVLSMYREKPEAMDSILRAKVIEMQTALKPLETESNFDHEFRLKVEKEVRTLLEGRTVSTANSLSSQEQKP